MDYETVYLTRIQSSFSQTSKFQHDFHICLSFFPLFWVCKDNTFCAQSLNKIGPKSFVGPVEVNLKEEI